MDLVFIKIAVYQFVEVEGFEPSSKRGPNKLSTCLAIDLIFVS